LETETFNSPEKALQYKTEYGIDGIMIGRAAIGIHGFSTRSNTTSKQESG
jgi:tRNA-dihydrouridine synthase